MFSACRAGLWIARREELGHPLGTITPTSLSTSSDDEAAAAAGQALSSPELFVLEVGSEELPPDDVLSGMEQLRWVLLVVPVTVLLCCDVKLPWSPTDASRRRTE